MKVCRQLLKTLCAFLTALGILSVLLIPYSTLPVHIPNEKGYTDYTWPPGSYWSMMTEGYGSGFHDAEGFNNTEDVEQPDIIVLGSSHIEGHVVSQKENLCYLLDEMTGEAFRVKNLGMSGHTFDRCCRYLEEHISRYDEAPKLVIIETENATLTQETVTQILDKSLPVLPSNHTGAAAMLQQSPFVRRLYHQYTGGLLDLLLQKDTGTGPEYAAEEVPLPSAEDAGTIDTAPYEMLFSWLQEVQSAYGTRIVILYHRLGALTADGRLYFRQDEAHHAFMDAAARHDITVLDMSDAFVRMYEEEHRVPHGFANTRVVYGHLNRYGHARCAQELYALIEEMVKDGRLCR